MDRRHLAAIAASLAAHGAVALVATTRAPHVRVIADRPDREIEVEILVEADTEVRDPPVEAARDAERVQPAPGRSETRRATSTSGAAIAEATMGGTTGSEPRSTGDPGPPVGPPVGPSPPRAAPDLNPSAAVTRLFDPGPPRDPGPLGPLRPTPTGPRSELRPDRGGRKAEESVFTARVGPDGRVSFEDRPNVQAGVAEVPAESDARDRHYQEDPQGPAVEEGNLRPGVAVGSFDLTDGVMRAAGQDPYAARKLAFMDRTRDERQGMAMTEVDANLKEALRRLPAELDRIWRGGGDAVDRRRLLFELWDECAETGSGQVLTASRAVRATIVGFIRRRVPAGSAAAYPDAELRALNRRRTSRQRFDPYAPP